MSTDTVQRGAGPWLGRGALIGVVALLLIEVIAIVIGSGRQWMLATVLGELVIGLTIATFLAGITAAVLDRGRRSGRIAAVLSVLVNPLVQIAVLGWFGNS